MDNNDDSRSFSMQLFLGMNNSALPEWTDRSLHKTCFSLNNISSCTEDNVDECIAHLNKVFRNMCLSSWIEEEQNQMVSLVNACSELIERSQRDSRIREDLEARTRRTMSDYDQLQTAQLRLKDDIERLEREIALKHEKEKDLSHKNRNLSSAVKSEKDEVKRLHSVINHRDAQYKHESKKKERESNRLKEKLNQVLMDKSQKLLGNDVINILPKTDSKRGTWKTTSKPEELYKMMLRNYEEKQKEMMQENLDLRNCLGTIQQRLHSLVENYKDQLRSKSPGSAESSCDESSCFEEEDLHEDFNDKFHQVVCNGEVSGIDYLPFEMSKEEIMKDFNKACQVLTQLLKKKLKESDENLSLTVPCSSVMSDGNTRQQADLELQLSELKKEVEEYKGIIEVQDQVLRNAVESMPESEPNNSFLHESHLLFEYEELEAKKRLFLEEKENFDKERVLFTNAAIRLAEEKRTFNDEKFHQIKHQILEMTPHRGGNKTKRLSYGNECGNRLLPLTPSSEHSTNSKPNKSEIYKTLDLCQNHFQNRGRYSLDNFSVPDPIQSSSSSPSSYSQQYARSPSYHESFQHSSLPSTPIEDHQNNSRRLRLTSSSNTSPSCRRQSAPITSTSNSLVIPDNSGLRRNVNYTSLTALNDKMYLSPDYLPRLRSHSVEDHQRSSVKTEP